MSIALPHAKALLFAFAVAISSTDASAQVNGEACPRGGKCVQARFGYTSFSPDSKHLYFTYQYYPHPLTSNTTSTRPVSGEVLARVNLAEGIIEPVKADCRFDYGNPALSPNGQYLLFSVDDRRHGGEYAPNQHLELIDFHAKTTERISVTDYNSKHYFAPFFSADNRYVYFARASSFHQVMLFSYDVSARTVDLIFPRITERIELPKSEGESPSIRRYHVDFDQSGLIRSMARPGFLDRDNEIVFYGSLPHPVAAHRALASLSRLVALPIRQLRMRRLIYSVNLSTKELRLHPASDHLDLGKMGIGAFRVVHGEGIFLLNGYYKFPTVDQTVYRYDAATRSLVKFDEVDHANYQWFDVSPNLRWIVYTHSPHLRAGDQATTASSEMVIKDRQTSGRRAFKIVSRVSDLPVSQACDTQ